LIGLSLKFRWSSTYFETKLPDRKNHKETNENSLFASYQISINEMIKRDEKSEDDKMA